MNFATILKLTDEEKALAERQLLDEREKEKIKLILFWIYILLTVPVNVVLAFTVITGR